MNQQSSGRGGSIVPSAAGALTPQQIQNRAVEVLLPRDRPQLEPQIVALCQQREFGQVQGVMERYARQMNREYMAFSEEQQAMHRATFDRFNTLYYSNLKPALTAFTQALAAHSQSIDRNTQELGLSSRATVANTLQLQQSNQRIAQLTQQVENLAIVSQGLSDQMERSQRSPQYLPAPPPQQTHITHTHSYSGDPLASWAWLWAALILTGATAALWNPVVSVIRVPSYSVPVQPAPPPVQVPVEGGV
ncbi:MAG: hypothetical protein AAGF75_00485 [Cyanobacteria bacterium P01_H01_bin.130]